MSETCDFIEDFISDLTCQLINELHLDAAQADAFVNKIYIRFLEKWSGTQIYISKKYLIELRNQQIYNDYRNGLDIRNLVIKYKMGIHTIYRLINGKADASAIPDRHP